MVCRAPVRTEDVYKLYAESFRDRAHLEQSVEAQALVTHVL
jgi:phosphoglucomutase